MNPRPVQIDLDGVLADFTAGYTRLAHQLGFDCETTSDVLAPSYGTGWLTTAEVDAKVWEAIRQSGLFWSTLPALVSRGTMAHLADVCRDRDVYFVTNRTGFRVQEQSVRWLAAHEVHAAAVIVTRRKGVFAEVVEPEWSLEDVPPNALDIARRSPRTTSVVIDRPYNQGFRREELEAGVRRVSRVDQFLYLVEVTT